MGRRMLPAMAAITAGLLVAALAAGCSSASGRSAPAVEKHDLTVAAVPVGDEAGLYVAQDLGLFKAEGLHVTSDSIISAAGNSVYYVQDQVSHQSNLEITAVGSLMQPGNQALYTLPDSPITTIADLKGKRIGVNVPDNIGTLLISELLKDHGMSPSEVHFVPMNFPLMGPALQKHEIDVAWLPEPFGSIFGAAMGLRMLADLDQGAAANFPVGWYVVTRAWAEKYPRTLAAFVTALRQGQEIADTNRSEVQRVMEGLPQPYTVPAPIAAVMTLESYPLTISLPTVQRVADEMYQFQMLSRPFRVSSMLG